MDNKLELLSPAGDFERLQMSLHYGADAVYLAGKQFGLRASAGNFDEAELSRARELCSSYGAKMYITINSVLHEGELPQLPDFLKSCAACGADGFIISDLGVMAAAKKHAPDVPVHISTQLGVLNSATATMLHEMGAARVVLAREMSIDEIATLRAKTPKTLEIEAFVHGAMCVSFSGRCLLSNYLSGARRDANGGACSQPCRWKYHLVEERRPGEYMEISEDGGTHIMNSFDMCMIEHLGALASAGISSFKIEGRMKSAYYAAMATYAYRGALNDFLAGREFNKAWLSECFKISHRKYGTGFYFGEPQQYYPDAMYFADADVCAVVEQCDEDGNAVLTQRNKFHKGDELELVCRGALPVPFKADDLRNKDGEAIESTPHSMMILKMRLPKMAEKFSVVRKIKNT